MKKSNDHSKKKGYQQDLLDHTFRPRRFESFIGQEKVKKNLKIFIESSKKRNEKLDHVLLCGPPGLGKTTLAYLIAQEMTSDIKIIQAPVLKKTGDLASHLTNLKNNDIFFIDEIHRLKIQLEEILYSAMEDFKIDIMIGEGVSAKSIRLSLANFTLIGATTKMGLLSSPLQSRFSIVERLELYNEEELTEIIFQSARIIHINIDLKSVQEISRRSRGTPRIANNLLKRVRDFAEYDNKKKIDIDITLKAFDKLEIDPMGLNKMDQRLLRIIEKDFNGGPVGLNTLAISLGETSLTLEDHYEPYLIQKGLIARTPKGRILTNSYYSYLNLVKNKKTNFIEE